jgi:hypothetical protein
MIMLDSAMPEQAQPIDVLSDGVPQAEYLDLKVIDDGIYLWIYCNNYLLWKNPVSLYIGNTYFGITGGDYDGEIGAVTNLTIQTAPISVFTDAYLSLLCQQYQGAPNLKAIVSAEAAQSFDMQSTAQAIPTAEALATATGEQLTGFGLLLNVARGTYTDDELRAQCYLTIFRNFSDGTAEDLIYIFQQMMAVPTTEGERLVVLTEYQPATFTLQANFPSGATLPTAAQLVATRAAIQACKASGTTIGMLSYTQYQPFGFSQDPDPQSDVLGLDDGSQTTGGLLAINF